MADENEVDEVLIGRQIGVPTIVTFTKPDLSEDLLDSLADEFDDLLDQDFGISDASKDRLADTFGVFFGELPDPPEDPNAIPEDMPWLGEEAGAEEKPTPRSKPVLVAVCVCHSPTP